MTDRTLEVHNIPAPAFGSTHDPREALLSGLEDAIDRASDQDEITWLTDHGKRIAAIVPADQAEVIQTAMQVIGGQPELLKTLAEQVQVLPKGTTVKDILTPVPPA